jgi:hypothetical protein
MNGFTKLFNQILDSTIWREDDRTRILWITMLAMADRDGIVRSSVPGLADRARISIEDCEAGLERFQQADKYSTSQDDEGRRIRLVDGGWLLINHSKYRVLMSAEDQREKARIRKQNQRARVKQRDTSRSVTPGHECHDIAEAEADTNKNPSSELNPSSDGVISQLSKKPKTEPSKEACRLAQLLKTEILRNKPDYRITPASERSWAQTADRMIRLDHRDTERIAELIRWAQRDEFWMSNILSMDKLREKFDALELKAGGSKIKTAPAKPVSAVEQLRKSLGVAAVEADYRLPTDLDRDAGEEIWRSALGKLAERIDRHSFDIWLRPCKAAGVRDQTLYLKLPTVNFSHVGDKYATELAEVLPGLKVEFLIPQAVLEVGRGAAAD